MKNETLKRDLASRMFDGVKVRDDYGMIGVLTSISNNESYECVNIVYNGITDMLHFEEFKPFLFPNSSLTKEIQVSNYNNGEPFVPIVEMAKIHVKWNEYDENLNVKTNGVLDRQFNLVITWSNDSGMNDFFDDNLFIFIKYPDKNQLWVIELLNRWHINYRLSPDQFIEVTEENNPYK